jgi:hypothetical protein
MNKGTPSIPGYSPWQQAQQVQPYVNTAVHGSVNPPRPASGISVPPTLTPGMAHLLSTGNLGNLIQALRNPQSAQDHHVLMNPHINFSNP